MASDPVAVAPPVSANTTTKLEAPRSGVAEMVPESDTPTTVDMVPVARPTTDIEDRRRAPLTTLREEPAADMLVRRVPLSVPAALPAASIEDRRRGPVIAPLADPTACMEDRMWKAEDSAAVARGAAMKLLRSW